MAGNFFVMLYHPNDSAGYVPMTDENDDLAKFDEYQDARLAAMETTLGSNCGFEVFSIENGL